ncbi:MAG: histidine ammonia-lyase [Gammaproteobacteria bacterium]|nr:histidine ammonia-lyase [Gammaproteobacteria bacterium]
MFMLTPGELSLNKIKTLLEQPISIHLNHDAFQRIEKARALVQQLAGGEQSVYGINTGFGKLAHKKIPNADLCLLQKNLILSHAVGVGELLSQETVQLLMLLKINSLARGYSGVSKELIQYLVMFYNLRIIPLIPSQGSVGASGDLAPLAYLGLAMMGQGQVYYQGQVLDAAKALKLANLQPYSFQEKEGLSLLNGTQVSCAIAIISLLKHQRNFCLAVLTGACSLDAAAGNLHAFHLKIAELKNSPGAIQFSNVFNQLLENSQISTDPHLSRRIQDPYCLRCQPQVMGSILDGLTDIEKYLIREANAVSDNPLILLEEQQCISGGNFHAEQVALCADQLSILGAEMGALSERRTAFLLDSHMSGLPAFLVEHSGLNSGFMVAQVTAAALASENKTYAHPASVDSIPTSANQEDHVSMAPFAGLKSLKIAENVLHIIAIEMLAACQGIDFRMPLTTSGLLQIYHQKIRQKIKFYQKDRYLGQDIKEAVQLMQSYPFYGMLYEKIFSF